MKTLQQLCAENILKENKIDIMGQEPFCNIPIRCKENKDVFVFNNNNWDYISEHFELSEAFLENNKDKLSWEYICKNLNLSIDMVIKYRNKIEQQCLTKEFVAKFIDYISLYSLLCNNTTPFFAMYNEEGELLFIEKSSMRM